MKIIALTDIHGRLDYLPQIAPELAGADLVLIAGDITTFGGEPHAHRIVSSLEIHNPNILAVHGNCDQQSVEEYLHLCEIALDGRCRTIDGVAFAGLGGSLPCPGTTCNESPESEFTARLEELKSQIDRDRPLVFVSHQPPWGTKLDTVGTDRHTGSKAIRNFILETQPICALSGHIHEAATTDTLRDTTLINPGPFAHGRYAYIEIEDNTVKTAQLRSL